MTQADPAMPSSHIVTRNAAAVQRPAAHRRQDLANGHVGRRHRRGQHGVVQLGVLELLEHVAGGVEDRPVHRRRRKQCRGDELVRSRS